MSSSVSGSTASGPASYSARYEMKANISPSTSSTTSRSGGSFRPQPPPSASRTAAAAVSGIDSRATYPPTSGGASGGMLITTADARAGNHDVDFYESVLKEIPDAPEVAHSVLFTHRCVLEDAETPEEQLRRVDDSVNSWRVERSAEHGHEARLRAEMEEMAAVSERVEYERRCDEQRIRMASMQTRLEELDRMFNSRLDLQSPPRKQQQQSGDDTTTTSLPTLLSPLKPEWDELAQRQKGREKEMSRELEALRLKQSEKVSRDVRFEFFANMGKTGITEQLSRAVILSEEEKVRVQMRRQACNGKERVQVLDHARTYLADGVVRGQLSAWSCLMAEFDEGPLYPTPQHQSPPRSPTPPTTEHDDQLRAREILEEARTQQEREDAECEKEEEEHRRQQAALDVFPVVPPHQIDRDVYQVDGCCTMLAGGDDTATVQPPQYEEDGHEQQQQHGPQDNNMGGGNNYHYEGDDAEGVDARGGDQYHDDDQDGDAQAADSTTHEDGDTTANSHQQQEQVTQEQPLQEVDKDTIEYTSSINENRPVGTASARQKRRPQQHHQQNPDTVADGEGAAVLQGGEEGGGDDRAGSARWERRRTSNEASIISPVRGNDVVERGYEKILSDQQEQGVDDQYEAIGDREPNYSDDDGFDAPDGEEHIDDPYSTSTPYSDDDHKDDYSSEL